MIWRVSETTPGRVVGFAAGFPNDLASASFQAEKTNPTAPIRAEFEGDENAKVV
jgi:hypothetical protein